VKKTVIETIRLEIYPGILAGSDQVDFISLSGSDKVNSSGSDHITHIIYSIVVDPSSSIRILIRIISSGSDKVLIRFIVLRYMIDPDLIRI